MQSDDLVTLCDEVRQRQGFLGIRDVLTLVEKVAWPKLLRLTGDWVWPSMTNWTVPVGRRAPGEVEVTLAVKVTRLPKNAGVADVEIVVLVAAWFTT